MHQLSKIKFILILFLASDSQAWASPAVSFVVSKPHALFNFVGVITGEGYGSQNIKELFDRRFKDNGDIQKMLVDTAHAMEPLRTSYQYKNIPRSRKTTQRAYELFAIQSVYSADIDDFSQRTLGILTVSDHSRLFHKLREFEKIYDALIWKENVAKINDHAKRLDSFSKKINFEMMFEQATQFYNSKWPNDIPFSIALVPIPGDKGHNFAQSLGATESVGVFVDSKDEVKRFGVIFHELCHSLYQAQSPAFQSEWESYFYSSPSPFANYAYAELNEALATAIGNGWAQERAIGNLDTASWYNDEYTDRYAKALYPLVKERLGARKSMDQSFAQEVVILYEKTFPGALTEYANIFRRVVILTDGIIRGREAQSMLKSTFQIGNIPYGAPFSDRRSIESLKEIPSNLLAVLSENIETEVEALKQIIPDDAGKVLEKLMSANQDSVLCSVDKKGLAYIVIKSRTSKVLKEHLQKIKQMSTCSEQNQILPL
jgi:hypothetical protein